MTTEVESTVDQEVPATQTEEQVVEAQDDGGFAAAFEAARSGEELPPEPAAEEPVAGPEPAPPEPTIDERFAALEAKFSQELGRVRDTAAGRIGEVNQRMQQMLSQQQTAGQSSLKLSKDNMKRLSSEFPEIAEMLAEDLSEALKGYGGSSSQFDPSVIDQKVAEATTVIADRLTKDNERFRLSLVEENWEEVIGVPDVDGNIPDTEYRRWLSKQDDEYQQKVGGSWNAREIAASIKKFREDTAKAKQQVQQRKTRLADAVTPTGGTQVAPAPDATDDFLAGFRSVRG